MQTLTFYLNSWVGGEVLKSTLFEQMGDDLTNIAAAFPPRNPQSSDFPSNLHQKRVALSQWFQSLFEPLPKSREQLCLIILFINSSRISCRKFIL